MKRYLIAAALAVTSGLAFADKEFTVEATDGSTYEAFLTGAHYSPNKEGKLQADALYQITDKKTNTRKRVRFAVLGCKEAQGTLLIVDAEGNTLSIVSEWVFGGPSMVDSVALNTCVVAFQASVKAEKQ